MSERVHHIRLLAGLEIQAGEDPLRTLDRHRAERLAGHLAEDLRRVVSSVEEGMLVLGASLLEPFELIRPGFPAWQALEDLAGTTLRERGFEPRILAIGSHRSNMPDARLQPPESPPQGQFLALPLILVCPEASAEDLRRAFEESLFERGSIDPPARALLSEAAGLETVHGQLLTLADLIALQHVQLDGAGLGGFWPAVEHVLVEEDRASEPDLPAGLRARWDVEARHYEIAFLTFDQSHYTAEDYALWLRAFRTLTALLDSHGMAWRAVPSEPAVFDPETVSLIESAGACEFRDGITMHHHPDVGLVAWTVVEDGRLIHIYPLRPESAERVTSDLAARGLRRLEGGRQMHIDAETGRLRPAEP